MQFLRDARKENGWYLINGRRIPSVTTILSETADKKWLEDWKSKTPNWKEISKKATTIGSLAHYRILNTFAISNMEPPDIPTIEWPENIDSILLIIDEAAEILKSMNIDRKKPIYIEQTVFHARYPAYAGTLDMVATIDGEITIIDLKTSKRLDNDYTLQLGGYSKALKRNGIKCRKGILLRCNAETGVEIKEIPENDLKKAEHEFIDRAIKFWENNNNKNARP